MAEENKKQPVEIEEKESKKVEKGKETEKPETKDKKQEEKPEKVEEKKEEEKKKKEDKKKIKESGKKEAIVNGRDLPLSKKHCVALCDFIRGKKIEQAMNDLQEVTKMKKAVPMKGEIPHRRGRIMSGRYPVNAAERFIKLLRQLSANATNNDMDLDEGIIECKADQANRPYKRFGSMKFKRSHVTLKLKIKDKPKKGK